MDKLTPQGLTPQGLTIIGPTDKTNAVRIYAFDLDHTLIKPKNEHKFPIGAADWMWLDPRVPEKLRELKQDPTNTLVIFSNQKGVQSGIIQMDDLINKMRAVFRELSFEITTFFATSSDKWRKPSPLMLRYYLENIATQADITNSHYIGDAAGRASDFSADDVKFSMNCQFGRFRTPEEFFWNAPYKERTIVDNSLHWTYDETAGMYDDQFARIRNMPEMVIFVGLPASGKSFLTKKYFAQYTIVNQDTINHGNAGTQSHCIKAVTIAIANRANIVIDNTSPDKRSRAYYIKLAREFGYSVCIVYIVLPRGMSEHLNFLRMVSGGRFVPKIAFAVWTKKHEPPTPDEYDVLITIDNLPFEPGNIDSHLIS